MSKTTKRKSREQRRRERDRARPVESRVVGADADPEGPGPSTGHDAERPDPHHTDRPASPTTPGDRFNDGDDRSGGALQRHDAPRPEAYVRPGLMQRLFGGGNRNDDDASPDHDQRPGLLRPFARRAWQREQAIASMREGFDNLSDLMSDIRDGLEQSVEKQGELLDQLKYLPVVVEQNADASRRFEQQFVEANRIQNEGLKVQNESVRMQAEAVQALRESTKGQHNQQEQLNKLLGTLGRDTRDQKRDLDELQDRLERMRQSDQAIADNLSLVGQAIRRVGDQGRTNSEWTRQMQENFEARTRQIEERMRRQSSAMTWLVGLVAFLALAALAAVAVVGFLYLRQTGAV